MSEPQTDEHSEETHDRLNCNQDAQDSATTRASISLDRRAFLSRTGASTLAAAAATVGLPSVLLSQNAEARRAPDQDERSGEEEDSSRRERCFQIRVKAATAERKIPPPQQINNGDEALYPNFIGNYSQGLPHNGIGEVDANAYRALLKAVRTGDPNEFAEIPLGGNTKLAGPQGGIAFDMEGTDSAQMTIPPSPALASAERAGEMVEDYWMALARDIPFSQYGSEAITTAAIADLNKLSDFRGPKVNGKVTAGTLFRGGTPGELIGPYLSQFFLLPVSFGTLSVTQKFNTYLASADYLTDFTSWLEVQNGQGPFAANTISGTTFLKNGRDLGAWVHIDFTYQAYLFAAQWLIGNRAPLNPGNPYLTSTNQSGVQTFGPQHILDLLGEVSNRALKAMWYQKWFVHRTLRPIAYGGLVHNTILGVAKYSIHGNVIHGDVLNSSGASQVFSKHGSYLLPAAYPEGNPTHPSYAEGHGVIAGACVTALKAFFNESFVIPKPMVPADDGLQLLPYTDSDAGQITVGGELNKLANNVALGRDMAGVHWRSDAEQSLLLGEAVAISILRDQRATYNEPFNGFTFTKFDGTTITV
jgi:hypothetical protein